jgi:hypothetical protein
MFCDGARMRGVVVSITDGIPIAENHTSSRAPRAYASQL